MTPERHYHDDYSHLTPLVAYVRVGQLVRTRTESVLVDGLGKDGGTT
jgi:hypothetical protein